MNKFCDWCHEVHPQGTLMLMAAIGNSTTCEVIDITVCQSGMRIMEARTDTRDMRIFLKGHGKDSFSYDMLATESEL